MLLHSPQVQADPHTLTTSMVDMVFRLQGTLRDGDEMAQCPDTFELRSTFVRSSDMQYDVGKALLGTYSA